MELNPTPGKTAPEGAAPWRRESPSPGFKVSRPRLGPRPASWVDTATVSTRACPLEEQDTDGSDQKAPESGRERAAIWGILRSVDGIMSLTTAIRDPQTGDHVGFHDTEGLRWPLELKTLTS